MRALFFLLPVILFTSMISVFIGCDYSRGSVEGTMTDENGKPVAEAIVRAERSEFPGILIKTDDDGRYSFNNIPAGKWEIEFYDKVGWRIGLESITVRANETITLDFTIGAKPPPPGPSKKIYYN